MTTKTLNSQWITKLCIILASVFLGILMPMTFFAPVGSFIGDHPISSILFRRVLPIALTAAIGFICATLLAITKKSQPRQAAFLVFTFGIFWAAMAASDYHEARYQLRNESERLQIRACVGTGLGILIGCKRYADNHSGQWPQTLNQLSPDYVPTEVTVAAISGSGNIPGFDYMPPSLSASNHSIVIVSKFEASTLHHQYIIGYYDGTLRVQQKPFDP